MNKICDTCINNMNDHSSNWQDYCWFRRYYPDTEQWDRIWNGENQNCLNYKKSKGNKY